MNSERIQKNMNSVSVLPKCGRMGMDAADAEKRLQNSAYMDASMLDARMLQGAEKKHDAGSYVHRTEDRSCKRLRKWIVRRMRL